MNKKKKEKEVEAMFIKFIKKHKISIICAVIALVFAAFQIFELIRPYQRWNFVDNGKNDFYAQGIALHETKTYMFQGYLPQAQTGIYPPKAITAKIALSCDIHYYAVPEDAEPVLTLEKGTEVYITPAGEDYLYDSYGLVCWPDYREGWRYGQPFVTERDGNIVYDGVKYFVRTKELEDAAREFWKKNCRLVEQDGDYWTYGYEIKRTINRYLYDSGAFYSGEVG